MGTIIIYMKQVQTYVMKTISCREAGFDCDYIVRGETEEEVLKNGIEHAKSHHNMKEEDITDEMKEKIKGIIHSD